MTRLVEGKIAIITGAAQGIGQIIAETLAEQGADVVVADLQLEKAQAIAQEITASTDRRGIAVPVDVTDKASVEAMVQATKKEFGRVDILVNNAGITRDTLLLRMSEGDWDAVLNTNLKGAFHCVKAVQRTFLRQRSGRIINIGSVVGLSGNAGQANYAAAKAGLIGFTKSLAKELGSRNITANLVAPGFIQTAMTAKLPEQIVEKALELIPLGRMGQPKDVAAVVAFLASDNAAYLTGLVVRVDGGLAM